MNIIYELFIPASIVTFLFSLKGYDDVVYDFMNRKPTGQEGIKRIVFGSAKIMTALTGGELFLITLFPLLRRYEAAHNVQISQNQIVLASLVSMCLVWGAIGIFQNTIRLLQGRTTRPLYDFSIARHNLRQWGRRRE